MPSQVAAGKPIPQFARHGYFVSWSMNYLSIQDVMGGAGDNSFQSVIGYYYESKIPKHG